jgi:four helix bundle protein
MNGGAPAQRVRSFEDLFIYQKARELTNHVYALTREGTFARDFGLVDQIRRAAVSIMSNIAEGHERGSNQEYIQFLYIAKGSCGEVRAQLTVACDQGYVNKVDHDRLANTCRVISGGINNYIDKMKGSTYRGPKFTPSKHDPFIEAMEEQQRVLKQLAEERKEQSSRVQELKSSKGEPQSSNAQEFKSPREETDDPDS